MDVKQEICSAPPEADSHLAAAEYTGVKGRGMKRLLVTDFDRTLNVDGSISGRNREAIRQWREEGNLFAVATGREEMVLRGLLQENDVETDYLICSNGANIVSWEGKKLFQKTMDDDTAWQLTEFLIKEYAISVDVTLTEERVQVNGMETEVETETEILYYGINRKCSLEEFRKLRGQVLQVHIRFPERDSTRKAAEKTERLYAETAAFANETNLDIVAKGVDKAEAVSFLLNQIKEKCLPSVIGDSFNDVGMICRFRGYAMTAASEEVKKYAANSFDSVADCIDCLRSFPD